MRILIKATKLLVEMKFIFAGEGDYAEELKCLDNIEDVGFKSSALFRLSGMSRLD